MSLVKRQRVVENGEISLYNGNQGLLYSEAVVLEGHTGSILTGSFSKDGNHIATGGMDKVIRLWNLPVDDSVVSNYGVITGHKGALTSVKWLKDGTTLASASADATVGFWDIPTGKRIRKCEGHELVVNEVDVVNNLAVSASDDGYACIWDQREKHAVTEFKTDYPLLTACINSQENTVYFSGIDPTVHAYDIRSSEIPLWECNPGTDSVTSIAISHDDSQILSRSIKGEIRSISATPFVPKDIPRLNRKSYEGAPSGKESYLIRAKFTQNDAKIISGSEDKSVTIWDSSSGSILKKVTGHKGCVIDVDYHSTLPLMLSTSNDGTAIVRQI